MTEQVVWDEVREDASIIENSPHVEISKQYAIHITYVSHKYFLTIFNANVIFLWLLKKQLKRHTNPAKDQFNVNQWPAA